MTAFYLRVGYQYTHSRDEVWAELVRTVGILRQNTAAIATEMATIEPCSASLAVEYAKAFKQEHGDLTLSIDDAEKQIVMLASGGDPARGLKEKARRAFIRLVIQSMHPLGMNIDIVTA